MIRGEKCHVKRIEVSNLTKSLSHFLLRHALMTSLSLFTRILYISNQFRFQYSLSYQLLYTVGKHRPVLVWRLYCFAYHVLYGSGKGINLFSPGCVMLSGWFSWTVPTSAAAASQFAPGLDFAVDPWIVKCRLRWDSTLTGCPPFWVGEYCPKNYLRGPVSCFFF